MKRIKLSKEELTCLFALMTIVGMQVFEMGEFLGVWMAR